MTNSKTTEYLPATIMEKGLPVVKINRELHSLVHSVFTADRFNVLLPKAMNISPKVKVAIQLVELDTNSDLKKNRDFWSIDGQEVILSAQAIKKLAAAGNVRYTPSLTGIDGDPVYGNAGQIIRVRYKAHCTTIDSLGNMREGSGSYEYNYNEDAKNAKLKPNQIAQRRAFAHQLAETGAKKRAFFECLGIDSRLSIEDMKKPFIVPCVIDDINYDDPLVRKFLAQRALGISQELYGKEPAEVPYEVQPDQNLNGKTGERTPGAPAPASATGSSGEPEPEPDIPPPSAEPSPAGKRALFRSEWEQTTPEERGRKIAKMVKDQKLEEEFKKRNYGDPGKWPLTTQMKWIMELATRAGEIPKEVQG